jgi:predicted DNA-binding protein (MmcQ/YjbR family)
MESSLATFGRSEILDYVKRKFDCEPEYAFEKYPNYIALRHDKHGKWFGLIMNVPRDRLGLDGGEIVDVIDVKCRPLTVNILSEKLGFLPAYHMNKEHWITILLDGSVTKKDITKLIDESYELVGS